LIELYQIAAALYLAAGIGSLLGLLLPSPKMSRGGAWGLAVAAVVHSAAFASLHTMNPPPPLTDLVLVLSLAAWMSVLALLALMWWLRLPGLAAAVGPFAFLSVFVTALQLPDAGPARAGATGILPHAHVILGAGSLALLGLAGVAGGFFLLEHRRLKSKRSLRIAWSLPSLEALDNVNAVSLSVGFVLLSLGMLTGMAWREKVMGAFWAGGSHELWMVVVWLLYAGLVSLRFLGEQGARQSAASAVAGFAFLLFAVVGVGMWA
jgi:ABC-type uncharacterized transport system permease subunit